MKTTRTFLILPLLVAASGGCNGAAPTSPEAASPSLNGGGFGSGTRSDPTTAPAGGATTMSSDSTGRESGGGFGSGT